MLEFTCLACGKRLPATAALAGKRVLCPHCDSTVTVPHSSPTASIVAPEHAARAKITLPAAAASFRAGQPPVLPCDEALLIRKDMRSILLGYLPLLIVVAIVAILIALLVPAVQKVRMAAEHCQSISNLCQLGLSMHNHHDTMKGLPYNGIGPAIADTPWTGSWIFQIQPYFEGANWYANPELLRRPNFGIQNYMCAGRRRAIGSSTGMWSDYAINSWLNDPVAGAFNAPNAMRTLKEITDGTSNTILIGHATVDLPYGNDVTPQSGLIVEGGTSGTARNLGINVRDQDAGQTGQLSWGSPFPQGSLMCMGDGSVRLFNYAAFADLMPLLTPTGNEQVAPPDR